MATDTAQTIGNESPEETLHQRDFEKWVRDIGSKWRDDYLNTELKDLLLTPILRFVDQLEENDVIAYKQNDSNHKETLSIEVSKVPRESEHTFLDNVGDIIKEVLDLHSLEVKKWMNHQDWAQMTRTEWENILETTSKLKEETTESYNEEQTAVLKVLELSAENEKLEAQIKAKAFEISQLEFDYKRRLEVETKSLRKELEKAQEDLDKIQKQNDSSKDKQKIKTLEKAVADLEMDCDTKSASIARHEESFANLKTDLEGMQENLDEERAEKIRIENKLKVEEKQTSALNGKVNNFMVALKDKEHELKELQRNGRRTSSPVKGSGLDLAGELEGFSNVQRVREDFQHSESVRSPISPTISLPPAIPTVTVVEACPYGEYMGFILRQLAHYRHSPQVPYDLLSNTPLDEDAIFNVMSTMLAYYEHYQSLYVGGSGMRSIIKESNSYLSQQPNLAMYHSQAGYSREHLSTDDMDMMLRLYDQNKEMVEEEAEHVVGAQREKEEAFVKEITELKNELERYEMTNEKLQDGKKLIAGLRLSNDISTMLIESLLGEEARLREEEARLNVEKTQVDQIVEAKVKDLGATEAQIQQLRLQCSEKEQLIKDKDRMINDTDKDIVRRQKEIDDLRDKAEKSQEEIEKLKSNAEGFDVKLAKMAEESERLKQEARHLRAARDSAQDAVRRNQEELMIAKRSMKGDNSRTEGSTIDNSAREDSANENSGGEMNPDPIAYLSYNFLKEQLERATANSRKLRKSNDELSAKIIGLEANKLDTQGDAPSAAGCKEILQKVSKIGTRTKKEIKRMDAIMQVIIDEEKHRKLQADTSLPMLAADRKKYEDRIVELEKDYKQLQEHAKNTAKELETIQQQHAQNESHAVSFDTVDKKKYEDRIAELEDDCARYRQDAETLSEECEALREQSGQNGPYSIPSGTFNVNHVQKQNEQLQTDLAQVIVISKKLLVFYQKMQQVMRRFRETYILITKNPNPGVQLPGFRVDMDIYLDADLKKLRSRLEKLDNEIEAAPAEDKPQKERMKENLEREIEKYQHLINELDAFSKMADEAIVVSETCRLDPEPELVQKLAGDELAPAQAQRSTQGDYDDDDPQMSGIVGIEESDDDTLRGSGTQNAAVYGGSSQLVSMFAQSVLLICLLASIALFIFGFVVQKRQKERWSVANNFSRALFVNDANNSVTFMWAHLAVFALVNIAAIFKR